MKILNCFILVLLTLVIAACSGKSEKETLNTEDKIALLDAKIKKNPKDSELYFARSKAFLEQQKGKEALIDISKAISLNDKKVDYYILEADILFSNGETTLAFDALQNAVKVDNKSTEAYLKMAELSLFLRDYDKVNFNVNKVLEIDKLNPQAYFLKGFALKERGDTLQAIAAYRKAIELKSDYGEAFEELGILYSIKGDGLAIEYLNSAININPKNISALYALGKFYQDNENYQKALDTYKQALDIKPDDTKTLNSVGYINLEEKKAYDVALECFNKAIASDSNYVYAWLNRADTYAVTGQKQKAKADYERVLLLDSHNQYAKDQLTKLK
ncbi:MAG: tetratricopeptide repeat protein [Bacteroidales bacterium]|jgi:tetratricopeptide (TPR) repeat protein|nr:tetratricopeptide repeat protein [Bacteroidales bacterium]